MTAIFRHGGGLISLVVLLILTAACDTVTNPSSVAPVIVTFAPDSPTVSAASSCTTLRWETTGAFRVTLEGSSTGVTPWEVLEATLPPSGSRQVCPVAGRMYRLTVTGWCGHAQAITTVGRAAPLAPN